MTDISHEEIQQQVNEQAIIIASNLSKELEGVYNVRKQYEIYYKYTTIIVSSLPEATVSTINNALKDHDKVEFNRVLVEPIHAFLLDSLSSALLDLIEFDSDNYESITHQLQCEAANFPWYDPDEEIWMNRLSIDDEFAIKAQFTAAGKLNDYLDGEFKLEEV